VVPCQRDRAQLQTPQKSRLRCPKRRIDPRRQLSNMNTNQHTFQLQTLFLLHSHRNLFPISLIRLCRNRILSSHNSGHRILRRYSVGVVVHDSSPRPEANKYTPQNLHMYIFDFHFVTSIISTRLASLFLELCRNRAFADNRVGNGSRLPTQRPASCMGRSQQSCRPLPGPHSSSAEAYS